MTGVLLPNGGRLYGDGTTAPGLCGAVGDGVLLPNGGRLYGLSPCGDPPVPDLLDEFSWLADAARDKAWELTDQISATVATHAAPQVLNQGTGAFEGTALVGQMNLTGGTTSGEWFTDLDFRWDAGVLEHHQIDVASGHNIWQILYIPAVDTSIAWMEVSFLAQTDGTVDIFLDAGGDGAAGANRFNWTSAVAVGDWDDDGITIYSGRITCTALTGAVTLYTDGAVVDTGTASLPHVFHEPPDGSVVWAAGSNVGAWPVVSFDLLDGIDGDPIISFDATDTTGWTEENGTPTTAPVRSAYVGLPSLPYSLATSSAFNLPATLDRGIVVSMRAIQSNIDWVGRNVASLFSGGAGWAVVKFDGFGVPWSFVIGDGGAPIVTTFGTFDHDDHVLAVNVDRQTDILTTFVDGVLADTSDISGLGAVSPTATVTIGNGYAWVYAAGGIDRCFNTLDLTELNDLLL
jgi:hypothetical protein